MAQYQLGPERPKPFSVISEGYTPRVQARLPRLPVSDQYSFGSAYESKLCELVHRYLELGTDDRLCYIGEDKGSLAATIQLNFCLLPPVTTVLPGLIHYAESPTHKRHAFRIANTGAEEYFAGEARKPAPQFDKVLLLDAVQYMDNPRAAYANIMKTMSELGRILIIQRPAPMNTLPLAKDARTRLHDTDESYMQMIKDLQACNLDVRWDIECLPIIMPKVKWLAMLRDKFPSCLEVISNHEIKTGTRELAEGMLKYEGDVVEFSDRLLFVTACRPTGDDYPTIQRHGHPAALPAQGMDSLSYKMEVTSSIKRYVKQKEKAQRNQGGLLG